ncbi:MAG: AI-2E family transporter [Chloroflexota bacterium]
MDSNRLAKDLVLYGVIILGVVCALFTFRELISPMVIAFLLAYLLYPGVNQITRRTRLSRNQAVVLVYIGFLVLFVVLMVYFVPLVLDQASLLSYELAFLRTRPPWRLTA